MASIRQRSNKIQKTPSVGPGTGHRKRPTESGIGLPPGISQTVWQRNLLLSGLITVATLSAYAMVLRHPFVNYDDGIYVVNNSSVNSGLKWENIQWAFTSFAAGNWHPLTWLSHELDCQLFGLNASGHHATSLLLHLFNVFLVFFLLRKASKRTGASLLVAGLFALHPLNVESVAWVAERKNVLCTSFFLLALAAYGWYAQKPGATRYLAVTLAFVLALASKPMAITLPFVLLLLDFWPLQRIEWGTEPSVDLPVPRTRLSKLVLEKIPFFLLSVASGIVTWIAQSRSQSIASQSDWPLTLRLLTSGYAYIAYLWKAILPIKLSPFYPRAPIASWELWVACLSIVAITGLFCRARLSRPYLVVGWLWFIGTLVPVIGIIQVGGQAMADRYTYIPLLGVFVAMVWAAIDFADSNRLDLRWCAATAGVLLVVLSVLTWRQARYWNSDVALWGRALQVTDKNFVAEENLAVALLELGRDDEALPHLTNAVNIVPSDPTARLNLGTNLARHELLPETAIEHLQAVTELSQEPATLTAAYRGLGVIYSQIGDRRKARENFVQAARISPGSQNEIYNLAQIDTQDAVANLSREVSANPTPRGYFQLGELLRENNMIPDAQIAYQDALRLDPHLDAAKRALRNLKE